MLFQILALPLTFLEHTVIIQHLCRTLSHFLLYNEQRKKGKSDQLGGFKRETKIP